MKYRVIKRRVKLLLLRPLESAAFIIVSIGVLREGKLCYIPDSSYKAASAAAAG